MSKPHITVRISPPLLAQLNNYVKQSGTSRTDVVVSAIAQYLGHSESVPLSQRVSDLEAEVREIQLSLNASKHSEV